jgi:hypothetical protein
MNGVYGRMRPPRVGWRVVATLMVLVSAALALQVHSSLAGSYTAAMAVKQLEDDAAGYAVAHWGATADVAAWLTIAAIALAAAIWASYVLECWQYRRASLHGSEPIDVEGGLS